MPPCFPCPECGTLWSGIKWYPYPGIRCDTCGVTSEHWPQNLPDRTSSLKDEKNRIKQNDQHPSRLLECGHQCCSAREVRQTPFGWYGMGLSTVSGYRCCCCHQKKKWESCTPCWERSVERELRTYVADARRIDSSMRELRGIDGTFVKLTERATHDRHQRLRENQLYPAYHQTNRDGFRGIVQSHEMHRGSRGVAGGGIYFATDPEHTDHKMAVADGGFLLKCQVLLGNVNEWRARQEDHDMTFSKLMKLGYDSVHIPRPGGEEFVVYNSDQVELKEVRRWRGGRALGPWVRIEDLCVNSRQLQRFLSDDDF